MVLKEQVSLAPYTTFGVPAKAFQFCEVISSSELQSLLLSAATKPILVLGGGSNILFTKDFEGMVIHLQNKGITIVEETTDWVTVEAKAGENWHQFVLWCIEQDFGGVENLSLIPGNVGTAPIQNIGAYGVELQDVFLRCTTMHITTGKEVIFQKEECEFGYRDSIFKGIVKGQYIITSVQFRLTKNNHKLHISYGAIASELAKNNIENPSIADISETVVRIRQSKLPDPKVLGNGGSFFKNPIINLASFETFQQEFPDAPYYKIDQNHYKIPAGWLIEQCGFKGKRIGNTGAHKNQALVLVNYGNATGNEIWELAQEIQKIVYEKFEIHIEPEINII